MQTDRIYEFGPFRLYPVKRQLLRNGHPIPMPPKMFETLLVLVQRSGHIVEKEDFMRLVWSDAFVEESNLSQNIFMLRKILGKHPDGRLYIETVPKRGYRFSSIVREIEEDTANAGTEQQESTPFAPRAEKAATSDKPIHSLAVLPIHNASDDVRLDYLSDGITESIVNCLSQISSLRVMACSTVLCYKGQEVHPQEVGRELGVDGVVIGRVLSIGDDMIIRMELVDVERGWQRWGKQYEQKMSDLCSMQKEIVQDVMNNLRLSLTAQEQERVSKSHTENTAAYQLYLKGRFFLNKRTKGDYARAIDSFQQAINIDSKYSPAYSGLADSYIQYDFFGLKSPWQIVPIARAAAHRAIELDDMLAEAHTSMARIRLVYDRDFLGAENQFKRAIELNPRYAEGHSGYSRCLVELGRMEEAFAECKAALELAPLDLDINMYLGRHYLHARQVGEAIKQLQKTLELGPNFYRAQVLLGMAYGQNGQLAAAIAEYEKAATLTDTPIVSGFLGQAYALSGQREKALKLLDALLKRGNRTYVPPFAIALIHTGLGQKDEAFEWLEKAFIEHSHWQGWLEIIPEFDSLQSDPRLANIKHRLQFTTPVLPE
jgi:DNA-binding winged helix-turn-helix (wHTH) protein/tetratricopeptide (TPR) repeat protein